MKQVKDKDILININSTYLKSCKAELNTFPVLEKYKYLTTSCRKRNWIGFMHSCTTSWISASSLFPICHYWTNLINSGVPDYCCLATEVRHTWINQFVQ